MSTKTNWTDSDELALMFSNTYQPAFYKQLHRYVHASYRKHKALEQIRNLFTDPKKTSLPRIKKAASLLYYFPAAAIHQKKLNALQIK